MDSDDVTMFDILSRCGAVILGDEELQLIYVWNGSVTFNVFHYGGGNSWYCVDHWTTSEAPKDHADAIRRCEARREAHRKEDCEAAEEAEREIA